MPDITGWRSRSVFDVEIVISQEPSSSPQVPNDAVDVAAFLLYFCFWLHESADDPHPRIHGFPVFSRPGGFISVMRYVSAAAGSCSPLKKKPILKNGT